MVKPTPLFVYLAMTGLAVAQNAALPGGGNASGPAAARVAGASGTARLQFPNTDVKQVLDAYAVLTRKRVVIDNQVQGTVYIVVDGDVPVEEAIRIIETNLLLNGITLVPVEHSNIVKVVSNKSPRSAAIPVISDELMLPDGEQVVTFLAHLRYADPAEVQKTLTPYIGQAPGNYSFISALPQAQALLITENSAAIRGLLRILAAVDVPPAEVVSEFIALERADANDVLEKLKGIFEKQPGGSTATAPRATPAGNPVPAGAVAEVTAPGTVEIRAGALSEDTIISGKIKLTADVRTNRIHVVTRPVNMRFVRKLIREFDSSVAFGEPVSRPLRYVSVGDVLDVVVKAIMEPGMKEDTSSSSPAKDSRPSQTPGGAYNSTGGAGGLFGGGGGSGDSSGSGTLNVAEGLSTQPVDTTPEARIVGTTKIIADKNANAIIVLGGADARARIFRLLDKLDQRIPQVMLNTVIGELNLDQKEQFGVDYIIRNSGLGISPIILNGGSNTSTTRNDGTGTGAATVGSGNGGTTGTTSTGTTATTGTTTSNGTTVNSSTGTGVSSSTANSGRLASNFINFDSSNKPGLNLSNLLNQDTIRAVAAAGGSGLSGFITAGNSMTAIVTALENSNRFRVVSRPSVFTRNNKKAIIASGQEIAVPTSIQSALNSTNNSNGIVSNSVVQFKRVALQLEVVPLINSDREVALDILQKVDEVSGSTRIDNNDIPNIATRYVKTSVTVPDGGTLVLGGLIKQSMNRTKTGIPLLGSIPLLGYLFSNTGKEKIRTELVILIRPMVSWAPVESDFIRERAQEFMNTDPNLEASIYPRGVRLEPPAVPFRYPGPSAAARGAAEQALGTPVPLKGAPGKTTPPKSKSTPPHP